MATPPPHTHTIVEGKKAVVSQGIVAFGGGNKGRGHQGWQCTNMGYYKSHLGKLQKVGCSTYSKTAGWLPLEKEFRLLGRRPPLSTVCMTVKPWNVKRRKARLIEHAAALTNHLWLQNKFYQQTSLNLELRVFQNRFSPRSSSSIVHLSVIVAFI